MCKESRNSALNQKLFIRSSLRKALCLGYNGQLAEGLSLAKEIKEKYANALEGEFSSEIEIILQALQIRSESTTIKVI